MAKKSDDYLITNCLLFKKHKALIMDDLLPYINTKYIFVGGTLPNNKGDQTVKISVHSEPVEYIDGFDLFYEVEDMK